MIQKLRLLLLTVIMVYFVDIVFSQNNDVIWIIKPQFDVAGDFQEGLAPVNIGGTVNQYGYLQRGKWGYINKEGTVIINPQFDEAWLFQEDLALVRIDGKWGYINKEGTVIITPQFDEAWSFQEDMAVVIIDGKYGYINKEGTVIIKPQFDEAGVFQEGMARVKKNGKYGYIKNPLSAKEIAIHYEQAGAFVGTIYSIQGNEVIVAGNIAEKVRLFDTLCIFSGEKMVLLRADFPMMTTSKCRVISGSIKDLQKGMKVYLYNKKKQGE